MLRFSFFVLLFFLCSVSHAADHFMFNNAACFDPEEVRIVNPATVAISRNVSLTIRNYSALIFENKPLDGLILRNNGKSGSISTSESGLSFFLGYPERTEMNYAYGVVAALGNEMFLGASYEHWDSNYCYQEKGVDANYAYSQHFRELTIERSISLTKCLKGVSLGDMISISGLGLTRRYYEVENRTISIHNEGIPTSTALMVIDDTSHDAWEYGMTGGLFSFLQWGAVLKVPDPATHVMRSFVLSKWRYIRASDLLGYKKVALYSFPWRNIDVSNEHNYENPRVFSWAVTMPLPAHFQLFLGKNEFIMPERTLKRIDLTQIEEDDLAPLRYCSHVCAVSFMPYAKGWFNTIQYRFERTLKPSGADMLSYYVFGENREELSMWKLNIFSFERSCLALMAVRKDIWYDGDRKLLNACSNGVSWEWSF